MARGTAVQAPSRSFTIKKMRRQAAFAARAGPDRSGSAAGFSGEGAVADENMRQRRDRQEGRIFPAAVRGGEQPAVREMDRQRAEQDRQQRERDEAAVEAEQMATPPMSSARTIGQASAAGRADLARKPAKPGIVKTAYFSSAWAMNIMPSATRRAKTP